jgi:chromosome segregation ATPase
MGPSVPESPRTPSGPSAGRNWPRATGNSVEFEALRTQVAELQAALSAADQDGEAASFSPAVPRLIIESDRDADRDTQLLTELAAARQRFDRTRSEVEMAWSALDEAEARKAALEAKIASVRQELLALELQEAKVAEEHEDLLSEFARSVQRQGSEAAALAAAQHAVGQRRRQRQGAATVLRSGIASHRTSERLWRSD